MNGKNTRTYYLKPAELKLAKNNEPTEVTTVLGSCVSVCFYDPEQHFGAICHYMLPLWNGKGLQSPKYGNIAVKKCVDFMIRNGSSRTRLQAKIFGGARMISSQQDIFLIGERNIATAYEVLKQENISVSAASTGGNSGRKIIFNTETGLVRMKYIRKSH